MEIKAVLAHISLMITIVDVGLSLDIQRKGNFQIAFVPHCNNNKTFCEEVDHYPEEAFYNILKNSTYEKEYFNVQKTLHDELIGDRFRAERENYLCPSEVRSLFPKVALSANNTWKYVYNLKEYQQGIFVEECEHETSCTTAGRKLSGIKTRCIQKYSDRLFLVADEKGQPVWDLFWVPSACVCAYERTIQFNAPKKEK